MRPVHGYLRSDLSGFSQRPRRRAEKRAACRDEPVGRYMHTEHIDVGPDFSDAQIAETFLHHRVLIIPVVEAGTIQGVITRSEFFRRLAERFERST